VRTGCEPARPGVRRPVEATRRRVARADDRVLGRHAERERHFHAGRRRDAEPPSDDAEPADHDVALRREGARPRAVAVEVRRGHRRLGGAERLGDVVGQQVASHPEPRHVLEHPPIRPPSKDRLPLGVHDEVARSREAKHVTEERRFAGVGAPRLRLVDQHAAEDEGDGGRHDGAPAERAHDRREEEGEDGIERQPVLTRDEGPDGGDRRAVQTEDDHDQHAAHALHRAVGGAVREPGQGGGRGGARQEPGQATIGIGAAQAGDELVRDGAVVEGAERAPCGKEGRPGAGATAPSAGDACRRPAPTARPARSRTM
jgi:hypothetical protein